jgi:histidyl-tRNA synthetase
MPQVTRPARGMRDFLPDDVRRRDYVMGVIADVYQSYGFEPLETPALENIETLTGKYGEEGGKLIFKVLRRGEGEASGEADLALRYDLTVPLARVVAEYRGKLPKFFKRYQIQPVWRADRPARGRFREFFQCDVDAIGSRSMVVEAELCAAVSDILLTLRFENFHIKLNHRGVLTGLLNVCDVRPVQHATALIILDKMDKIGPDGVQRELEQHGILTPKLTKLFSELTALHQGQHPLGQANSVTITRLLELLGDDSSADSGARQLKEILDLSQHTSAKDRIKVDVTLARGLSYYTGAIMEVAVPDLAGSLGGGGRYDGLIGMFLGEEVPACGFSLGLERILVVMGERAMFPATIEAASADVLMPLFDESTIPEALKLAAELRRQGVRVEVYPEVDKLGKQMKYAASRAIPFAAILGADEITRGEVAIKNLGTGQQFSVPRTEVATLVLSAGPESRVPNPESHQRSRR